MASSARWPSTTLEAVAPVGATPAATGVATGGPTDLQTLEKQHILAVLDSVQGDKTRAAQLLGVSRRTLELFKVVASGGVPEVWLMGQKLLSLGT